MGRIILVRPLLPPPPQLTARLQPQYLHWQVGRYKERLVSGPGGLGRGRLWVPEQEGEQHNLILDAAYDTLIPQYGFLRLHKYAAVGTGSTPPAASQTALVNEVARTARDETGDATGTRTVTPLDPGVYDIQVVREFTESEVGNRNLTEWGFSPIGTVNGALMSRELFRDGNGNPIVLTLAADQRLHLIYKIRVTVVPISQAISLNISGLGTYTGTFRLYRTARSVYYPNYIDYPAADLVLIDAIARGSSSVLRAPNQDATAYTGLYWATQEQRSTYDPGNVAMQGNRYGPNPPIYSPVSGRSRQVQPQIWNASQANDPNLLSYVWGLYSTSSDSPGVAAAISFDAPLSKTNLYKLQIDEWTLTWGP